MAEYDDQNKLLDYEEDEYEMSMDDYSPEMALTPYRDSYLSDDDPTVSRWKPRYHYHYHYHYHYWHRRPMHRHY